MTNVTNSDSGFRVHVRDSSQFIIFLNPKLKMSASSQFAELQTPEAMLWISQVADKSKKFAAKERNPSDERDLYIRKLEDHLLNPHFEKWNGTSLDHVLYDVRGMNGHKCHELATQQLSEFLEWYKDKTITQGLFPFPTHARVESLLTDAVAFYKLHGENAREEWHKLVGPGHSLV